jgi:hypothetical protein
MHEQNTNVATVPAETWSHYDDFRGAWYDVPRLTVENKRAIARAAGVQFRGPDTDEVICPGANYHVYQTAPDDCKLVDREGVPRLICSKRGCECACAAPNAWMQEIRYDEIRAAARTRPYGEPSMALLVAIGYDGPDASSLDFIEATEERGLSLHAVMLKWKALKHKIAKCLQRKDGDIGGAE